MPNELADSIRQFASLYDRGILTPHEFVLQILDLFVTAEVSQSEIADAFSEIPVAITPALKTELHELANSDFYRRTFGVGDTRTESQVHANALTRQAPLRRICGILTPLVLVRDIRNSP